VDVPVGLCSAECHLSYLVALQHVPQCFMMRSALLNVLSLLIRGCLLCTAHACVYFSLKRCLVRDVTNQHGEGPAQNITQGAVLWNISK
jgi:hypothetical protein